MNRSALSGVWKISASLRGRHGALLPKRIRFAEEPCALTANLLPRAAVVESGSCSIPYADHCSGQYEVGTLEDGTAGNGELRADFKVECTANNDQGGTRLTFEGLYDGERIAGTVTDEAAGEVVADFLCTRLFTFWGAPKVKAAEDEDAPVPGAAPGSRADGGFIRDPLFRLQPKAGPVRTSDSNGTEAPPQHTRSHGTSHPKAVRLPACSGARGLRWLDAGLTTSVVETPNGARLHPGLHGLDLRDWLLLDEATRDAHLATKARLLGRPETRAQVLQADDPSTVGAQLEVLEMISSHLLWGGDGRAPAAASGDDMAGAVPRRTMQAIAGWAAARVDPAPAAPSAGSEAGGPNLCLRIS